MRISIFACLILPAALGVACSPPVVTDAGSDASSDVTALDVPSADVTADHAANDAVDATTTDSTTVDVASVDVATVDATPDDAPSADGSTDDVAAADVANDGPVTCEFIDSPSRIAYCTGTWTTISEWVNIAGPTPACPPYYSAGSVQAATVDEVVAALGCTDACVYRAATAVSFLHCGHRDEYTSYEPERSGCDPVLMFSNGVVYASIDEYNAANPCK
jgi:hypothetical protein